jgi:hypothetical protein
LNFSFHHVYIICIFYIYLDFGGFGSGGYIRQPPPPPLGAPLYAWYNSTVFSDFAWVCFTASKCSCDAGVMAVDEPNIGQGNVSVCSLPEPELRSCERLYCVHTGLTVIHSTLFLVISFIMVETCSQDLTFVGPCIVIYFCSKTNQMHNILNLFYFGTTHYMLRTVSPSIIRSLSLYIQHQVYVIQVLWLLSSGNEIELRSISFP